VNIINTLISTISSHSPSGVCFSIEFPDGQTKVFGRGKQSFSILIKTPKVYGAIAAKGLLGVGEQYMLGNFDITGDMDKAMITMATIFGATKLNENLWFKGLETGKKLIFRETKDKSLKDIGAHYDISNDFYKLFLDSTMTYSCAYFKSNKDSLEQAQHQKYEHLARKLRLRKGETLLDIGCGWGGMLIYAAQKYGVSGYGVTLSENQFSYARQLIAKLKLGHLVKVELKDYRDIRGQYDKFISIGMFEHVTKHYYEVFFDIVKKSLKPDGLGVLHTIGFNNNRSQTSPWMTTYIFPGSQIPALSWTIDSLTQSDLYPQDLENLRPHYALTLLSWIRNFEKAYTKVVHEKGERFARMWKFYLYLSRASFVVNISQLYQITFTNGINNQLHLTREEIYRTAK